MFEYLNHNGGAVTALATVALLAVTGWYAFTTWALLSETKRSRILAGEPRVVGYLRAHPVHANIVQLCIANLSSAPAVGVSCQIEKISDWPEQFDLENSPILRDLSFVRAQEVVSFDLGFGPDLFVDDRGASFAFAASFAGLDGRTFDFRATLNVDSVVGPSWKIYGVDDIARRLQDISDTLRGLTGHKRMQVDVFDSTDREHQRVLLQKRREESRAQRDGGTPPRA